MVPGTSFLTERFSAIKHKNRILKVTQFLVSSMESFDIFLSFDFHIVIKSKPHTVMGTKFTFERT